MDKMVDELDKKFLSTPSVGRATFCWPQAARTQRISIHALRGEGDLLTSLYPAHQMYFYPRPPWGGRRGDLVMDEGTFAFLSTPSVGRATPSGRATKPTSSYFYPRPPWGGRPGRDKPAVHYQKRFLSTPSVGRATDRKLICRSTTPFLSTPSVGRATGRRDLSGISGTISIHALRGEGDAIRRILPLPCKYFYPRPPWGGRPPSLRKRSWKRYFYPRPPWGGRRDYFRDGLGYLQISIHALRGEGDWAERSTRFPGSSFLSTPSVGRATCWI